MTRWAKNKQTLAYQLIANLMKQPASTTFNKVTIKVNDGEAARHKLEAAFLQLIESRKYEGDPAVFINNERVIEHVSHTPASPDPAPSTDATRPATADPRPATDVTPPATPDARPRPAVQSLVPGQGAGAALDGSDDNRSTTARFLSWHGHGKLF